MFTLETSGQIILLLGSNISNIIFFFFFLYSSYKEHERQPQSLSLEPVLLFFNCIVASCLHQTFNILKRSNDKVKLESKLKSCSNVKRKLICTPSQSLTEKKKLGGELMCSFGFTANCSRTFSRVFQDRWDPFRFDSIVTVWLF